MALNIIFKKVISEDRFLGEIEYGPNINFTFGENKTDMILPAGNPYGAPVLYNESDVDPGTDIESLGLSSGDILQAFSTDGEELGFRMIYRISGADRIVVVYNEEIGCFVSINTGWKCDKFYLVINKQFTASTIDGVLRKAQALWQSDASYKHYGMDNCYYAIFQPVGYRSSEHRWYFSTDANDIVVGTKVKMRYYSSWYKLLTGKFMNEDSLFHTELDGTMYGADEKHKNFYFGKVLEETEENPISTEFLNSLSISDRTQFNHYIINDKPMGVRDLIYGSSASFWKKEYGESLIFINGMSLVYEKTNDNDTSYASIGFINEEGDSFKMKAVYNGGRTMKADNTDRDYKPFAISCVLQSGYRTSGWNWGDWNAIYGADLFVSPIYNEIPANELSSFIMKQTSDNWAQLYSRVLTFVMTGLSQASETQQQNFYPGVGSIAGFSYAWSGWSHLSSSKGTTISTDPYNRYISIYKTGNTEVGCDFTQEAWSELMKYKKKKRDPYVPGGGYLGGDGGNGTGNREGDNITPPANDGFTTGGGGTLVPWDLGLNGASLGGIGGWLADTALGADFDVAAKQSTICSLKRFFYPFTPRRFYGLQTIVGIDGKKFPISEGNFLQGYDIGHQYDHNTIGTFTITKFFDSFLDYSPYTSIKLYLPFAGVIDLDPSDVVGNTIKIDSAIDWISGNIVYNVIVRNADVESVLYTASGNCGVDIPLTNVDYNGRVAAILGATITAAGAIAGAALAPMTGGASLLGTLGAGAGITAVSSGAIGAAGASVMNAKAQVSKVGGNNLSNNGGMSPLNAFLIIERPNVVLPQDFGSHYGYAASISGTVANFNGYTEVASAHLENIPCTASELDEINNILSSGFIA